MALHSGIADWTRDRTGGVLMPGLDAQSADDGDGLSWIEAVADLEDSGDRANPVDLTDEMLRRQRAERLSQRLQLSRTRAAAVSGRERSAARTAAWLGLAAAIGLVAYFGWHSAPAPSVGPGAITQDTIFARPIDGFQAQWDQASQPGSDGLTAGRYRLTHGEMRLLLSDDTQIKLVGPAEFELSAHGEIVLLEGKLVADVPRAGSGFRVHTPAGDIYDSGSRFGVEVLDPWTTETEVMAGRISAAAYLPDGGLAPFIVIEEDQAARLDMVSGRVDPIQAGGDRFSMDYVRVIDLVDAVAGGDGTTGRRNTGIDPRDGRWWGRPLGGEVDWSFVSDGRFHDVDRCPLVAGIFIPSPGSDPTQLDPAGHTYRELTVSQGYSYGLIWAGGFVSAPGSQPQLDTLIDGVNYAAPSRGLIRMHANAGICFDLGEVRRRHPGLTTTRFRTGFSNREATRRNSDGSDAGIYASVDLWVFVDGRLRLAERDVTTSDGMLEIDLPLNDDDQYLTVVVTDGMNQTTFDWVLLCQPRIDLRPSDRD